MALEELELGSEECGNLGKKTLPIRVRQLLACTSNSPGCAHVTKSQGKIHQGRTGGPAGTGRPLTTDPQTAEGRKTHVHMEANACRFQH